MTPGVGGDEPGPAPSVAGPTSASAEPVTPGGGSLCSAEHAGWLATPLRRLLHDPRRILAGLTAPGETAIDLGCGPGFFTLPLAEMVGPGGRVVAVDLQPAMLERLRLRAGKAGLAERITLHHCSVDGLGELPPADAALAFYMVHEVPDVARFLGEVAGALKPGGRLLLVEPRGHVSAAAFAATAALAAAAGLRPVATPSVRLSRTTVFARG
jgi:ubiquinone/menaquinone biosynthesis C-methylase UbiE